MLKTAESWRIRWSRVECVELMGAYRRNQNRSKSGKQPEVVRSRVKGKRGDGDMEGVVDDDRKIGDLGVSRRGRLKY